VRLNGQTDFGTVVPYLYNPQTGDIRTMESAESRNRSVNDPSRALSLTQTEEHIAHLIRKAEKLRTRQEAQLETESPPSTWRSSEQDATGITTAAQDVAKQAAAAAAWTCSASFEDEHESIVILGLECQSKFQLGLRLQKASSARNAAPHRSQGA